MLKLEHIDWNSPDGKPVLKDLELTVPDGKLVVITGPNGSGKTTLARIIAGIEKPSAGRIYLDGEDITGLDVTERARRGVSFAFQQPVRFKGITVRQLIDTAAGGEQDEARLCDILSKVGLCARDYIDREVNATLSGGEIKRIEIATVIARHTRLSLFDEPEAGIDLWSFKNLIGVFNDMHKDLTGTLMIISPSGAHTAHRGRDNPARGRLDTGQRRKGADAPGAPGQERGRGLLQRGGGVQ